MNQVKKIGRPPTQIIYKEVSYPYLNPTVNDTLKQGEILSKNYHNIIELTLIQ